MFCRSYLSYNDVAVGCLLVLDELVQDVLGHLGGLATAGRPTDNDHWVALNDGQNFGLKLLHWKAISLCNDLENYIFKYISKRWLSGGESG